jgi:hypothetical protein
VYNPPYAGNPPAAPSPPPPPSPEEAAEPAAAPRYEYLVNRLRNRQITMEEATELFAIQRRQVQVLLARTNALAAAAATPAAAVRMPAPPPRPAAATPAAIAAIENLDPWAEGLLFLGIGAGVLAALMKRAQGPAPSAPSKPNVPASSSRRS